MPPQISIPPLGKEPPGPSNRLLVPALPPLYEVLVGVAPLLVRQGLEKTTVTAETGLALVAFWGVAGGADAVIVAVAVDAGAAGDRGVGALHNDKRTDGWLGSTRNNHHKRKKRGTYPSPSKRRREGIARALLGRLGAGYLGLAAKNPDVVVVVAVAGGAVPVSAGRARVGHFI